MPSSKTTHQITIDAKSVFLEEYSDIQNSHYLFCYQITIRNEGLKTVQLLNRHWIILDSNSQREEVKGPGVLGLQPYIAPGESHQYYSFCNLKTNFGTMEGSYEMIDSDQNTFDVEIPRFFMAENLNEFDKPLYPRGQVVKHIHDAYKAVVVDYDMYFINDEDIYNHNPHRPSKQQPWYYIMIDKSNAISYVAQEHLKAVTEDENIEHPLLNFFFSGYTDGKFIRNHKTWEDLRAS